VTIDAGALEDLQRWWLGVHLGCGQCSKRFQRFRGGLFVGGFSLFFASRRCCICLLGRCLLTGTWWGMSCGIWVLIGAWVFLVCCFLDGVLDDGFSLCGNFDVNGGWILGSGHVTVVELWYLLLIVFLV
jgi:hypothetical protein